MRATFFKGSLVGGMAGTLMAAATVAVAGNGVGGVFNLGRVNTVDAKTELSGTVAAPDPQLKVLNNGTGPAIHGKSSGTTAGYGVLGEGRFGIVGGGEHAGVWANSTGTDPALATGVYGQAAVGKGVFGVHTSATGTEPGVQGETGSTDANAVGVLGIVRPTNAPSTAVGVRGIGNGSAVGVEGFKGIFRGQLGISGAGAVGFGAQSRGYLGRGSTGVEGSSTATNGTGVEGSSTRGYAFNARGNARQDRAASGWVKAMVYFNYQGSTASEKIGQCYNSQLPPAQATSGDCGITLRYSDLGRVVLDFGFQVADRFVLVTPRFQLLGIVANVDIFDWSAVDVSTLYADSGDRTNASFWLVIF